MDDATATAQQRIALGKQKLGEQKDCIDRQRALIERLAVGQETTKLREAQALLAQMSDRLTRMAHDLAAAENRLVELSDPLDEASLERVMRECPL